MVGHRASIPQGVGQDTPVARQAEELAGWTGELGLGPTVVVGHDLGGGVMQTLAAKHRSLMRGLVLTNSIAYGSWPVLPVRVMRSQAG